jgi:hypothetical protein
MGIQAIGVVEETVRGTDPDTGYLWFPTMGSLLPTFTASDEARTEFRGQDTAEGSTEASLVRRESQTTYSLESAYYPGAATGLMFKHTLGHAGTRSLEDTSAYKGPLSFSAQPYGTGNEQGDSGIGIMVLSDRNGTTYKQYFGGLRPFDYTISGEGTDDIKLIFNMKSPGEFIGTEVINDLTPSYTTLTQPYTSQDVQCYIGSGVSLTGTSPDYSDISPGSMVSFCPDSFSITVTSGRDDKTAMCGIQGPSKTFLSGSFNANVALPIDFEDPSSGFSSRDEFDKQYTGISSNALMFVMNNELLAGAATSTYESTHFFPAMLFNPDTPNIPSDGTQSTVSLNYSSLVDDTTEKAFLLQNVDKESAY